jgi:hypothetical protein
VGSDKLKAVVSERRKLKSLNIKSATFPFHGVNGLNFTIFTGILLWFVRALISSLICLIIGFAGIKSLDYMTTRVSEFKIIKGDALATSLFVSGFFIFAGLVVYGSMVNPFFLGQNIVLGAYFNLERLLIILLSFGMSFFIGWLFYFVFARLEPFGVDLDDVNKSPVAVGVFLFGYEVFLGLLIYGSLVIPL